ncbi:MAG: Rod shape-determining protein RodA [Parcubacteria group bacterium GW2011_GWB1_44_7]|nr:MAG: Rod shape-determining protein RodA [Parcubacteria group bacterium GW2011_GWB1_44_7]
MALSVGNSNFKHQRWLSFVTADIDWAIFFAALLLTCAGLVTMYSFKGDNLLFEKQIISLGLSVAVFFTLSFFDFRFLRQSKVSMGLYLAVILILTALLFGGRTVKGAQSWFDFGGFAFQPVDLAKVVLIAVLSKYFSRRHIEIANLRHLIISGVYTSLIAFLVLLQPDFGSAIIIMMIWFGMVWISGISKKHILGFFLFVVVSSLFLWSQVFEEYQKQRIINFMNPLADIRGTGYNAFQSTVAVGSGELLGKGVGFGTQSRLKFLPEYETDFIFSAFSEEWGFLGVLFLFSLYGLVFWRLILSAWHGATNFETLFCVGAVVFFLSHFLIHVGMNIGLLPVTGTTLPFMSYGGSHLLAEYSILGVIMGMRKYRRAADRESATNEVVGFV